MTVVSNSTPLIVFSRANQLRLFEKLFGKVIIPSAVHREILVQGVGKPGVGRLQNLTWLEMKPVTKSSAGLSSSLDAGEAEAIRLAIELNADFILLDDRLGRREAARSGIRAMGTIGVLQLAKAAGFILTIKPELDLMMQNGFYVSEPLYTQALKDAGE
jgi:predicted nucleic acid-binding protein